MTITRFIAVANEPAWKRLMSRMTDAEILRLLDASRASGKTAAEVIGSIVARAGRWQDLVLVATNESFENGGIAAEKQQIEVENGIAST